MKINREYVTRFALCTLTLLMIAFIFTNSAKDADSSSVQSRRVLYDINRILNSLHIDITLGDKFIRKAAHFVEYFVLGSLLLFTQLSFTHKLDRFVLVAPAVGLVVASIDEVIQLFAKGRSGQFSDVVLDFVGVAAAVLLMCAIIKRTRRNSKR